MVAHGQFECRRFWGGFYDYPSWREVELRAYLDLDVYSLMDSQVESFV